MKVGILTGGGDCSGLNAAIRGVAKSLMHELNAEIIGIEQGFLGLIENNARALDFQDVSGLINKGGTILHTCNNASPFNYQGQDVSGKVLENYRALNLDVIVAIGGDGTMSLCYELSKSGMNFIGIPKTIDNDLAHTDRTFGFETAVDVVVDAIDRLKTTSESHNRVMIVETMGRYAGWIALHAGLAGAADIILIPEFPFDVKEVIAQINKRAEYCSSSIIVIAEGAKAVDGDLTVNKTVQGSPDAIRLGGVGYSLQQQLEQHIPLEVRTTVLGHIQRGGCTSAFDRIFATNVGCYASALIAQKRFGRMVTVHNNHLSSIALKEVAHKVRQVPNDDMTLISALAMGISLGVQNLKIPLASLQDDQVIIG